MPIKKFVKDYLTFSTTDQKGVVALVVLVLIIYFLPIVFPAKAPRLLQAEIAMEADSVREEERERVRKRERVEIGDQEGRSFSEERPRAKPRDYRTGELFEFDPNVATADEFERMGLPEKTAGTILRYRSKGGKFFKADDFRKIWGLPPGFYDRVEKYIRIPAREQASSSSFTNHDQAFTRVPKTIAPVDINLGDSTVFEQLPGIGAKLSQRIVQFREKLGGFYSIDQIGEVYGLADSVFQNIKPHLQLSGTTKLISINTVTKDELKLHPYFRWKLANAIIEYRNQHGPFKSLEELKNISAIDENIFQKLAHYLTL